MNEIGLLVNLTAALAVALVLGLVAVRAGLSPLVGYLAAGIAIGPHTPGFVADADTAGQFADIGVVLLMFGVGLSFRLRDLLAVRWLALPGALVLSVAVALLGAAVARLAGLDWAASVILGLAISVSSTVVLTRVLLDHQMLGTVHGHIAVGWTVVEDLITILIIVTMPALAAGFGLGAGHAQETAGALGLALVKVALLAPLVLAIGRRAIPALLAWIVRTRSRELFTLAVLALALVVATGAALFFGVSIALGAFLAGLVVGQSESSHQAAADALPMRDAFAVLFFVSVGMLFDPAIVWERPGLLAALLGVILLAKPAMAVLIIWISGHTTRTALTIGLSLAQINKFSFMLARQAADQDVLPNEGHSLLVAASLLTIGINPVFFGALERILSAQPGGWRFHPGLRLRGLAVPGEPVPAIPLPDPPERVCAIVVGYGPVGQAIVRILEDFGIEPVIVEMNLDTVRELCGQGRRAIFGDAGNPAILGAAEIGQARYLLVTLPDLEGRMLVLTAARALNPGLRIFVRARYLKERAWLEEMGASDVAYEEAEAAVGLASLLLREVGAEDARIEEEGRRIRAELALRRPRPEPGRRSG